MSESLKSWPSRHCLLPHRRAKTSQHDIHFQILRNLCVCSQYVILLFFLVRLGGFSFHGSQNHSESFTYNSCIIIRNDSESPTNQLCESPPSNRVPGCPCRNGPRLQGTNDGPWQESEGSQGMKIPSPSITFLFPLKNFAKKMHQKSKSTYYVTTSCYYVDASFRSKIFLHNPHVPWFLVLLSRDEHEPQPATGSPGSHWVPPRAALVAFLRRFTLEKPGLELIMQRSTAGITDISQRSSDVSASGKDSQKVSKGDCWKVGDSQHQNQS